MNRHLNHQKPVVFREQLVAYKSEVVGQQWTSETLTVNPLGFEAEEIHLKPVVLVVLDFE